MCWSFVKYWFSSHVDLPNVYTFYYTIYLKNIFINIFANLRNVSKYWEAVKFTVADTCFPKILIFAGKLKFHHWQQILSVVFLEVTGSLGSFFKKMSAKCPSLNHPSLSVSRSFR